MYVHFQQVFSSYFFYLPLPVLPQLFLYQSEYKPSSLLPYFESNNFTLLKKFLFWNGWMEDSTGIKEWHLLWGSDIPSGFATVPPQFFSCQPLSLKNQPFSSATWFLHRCLGVFVFSYKLVRETFSELILMLVFVNAVFFHLNIYLWCNLIKGYLWDSLSQLCVFYKLWTT